jgi:Cupin
MAADALSDLLKTVRLTGAAFFDVAAKEPWVAESPPRDGAARSRLARARVK